MSRYDSHRMDVPLSLTMGWFLCQANIHPVRVVARHHQKASLLENMMDFDNSTTVKARASSPLHRSRVSPIATDDELDQNPSGRSISEPSSKKGSFQQKRAHNLGTLNCRSLSSEFSRAELNLHILTSNLSVFKNTVSYTRIMTLRLFHDIGKSILFTSYIICL